MKRVLLTSARSYITLDLARHLHAAGCEVFVAETSRWHICRFSRAIKKDLVVPSPRYHREKFLQALVDITTQYQIDFVLPTCEEIIYLSQGLHLFPPHCQVLCMPFELLHDLHNKWLFQERLKKHNLPTPVTTLVESRDELSDLNHDKDYILKPCYSRAAQQIYRVPHDQTPPNINIKPHNPWIAQEWLEGKKTCSYSVAHKGKLYAHSLYPVNYAIDGSSCLVFEAIHHQGILEWVQNFVEKENFTGQIAFDFIESPDGTLYAIECNPRATSGVHLFREEPRFAQALLEPTPKLIQPAKAVTQQIVAGMLLYGWKTDHPWKDLRGFLKVLFTTPDIVFDKKDWVPFLTTPFVLGKYAIDSVRYKMSIPSAFTHDIDWNGEGLRAMDR